MSPARRNTNQRLGELLIRRGLLEPWQVEAALEEQHVTRQFLGAILVQRGWISEDALLAALAEQFGIRWGHLAAEPVDWTLAPRFPFTALKEHACFPLRMDANEVVVAIANPLNAWAISELERLTQPRKVQLVLAPIAEIHAALHRSIREALERSVPRPLESESDDGDTQEA